MSCALDNGPAARVGTGRAIWSLDSNFLTLPRGALKHLSRSESSFTLHCSPLTTSPGPASPPPSPGGRVFKGVMGFSLGFTSPDCSSCLKGSDGSGFRSFHALVCFSRCSGALNVSCWQQRRCTAVLMCPGRPPGPPCPFSRHCFAARLSAGDGAGGPAPATTTR